MQSKKTETIRKFFLADFFAWFKCVKDDKTHLNTDCSEPALALVDDFMPKTNTDDINDLVFNSA